MINDKYFHVISYHGTQLFVDDRKLVHGTGLPFSPLYAERTDRGIAFFLLDGDHRQYVSAIQSDMTIELTDTPTILKQQSDDNDGSFFIVQRKKFLSTRRGTPDFWFVNLPRTWEKFFLSKANLFDADNISTLKTFHGTTVMLSDSSRLCHKNLIDRKQSEQMICARTSEKTINLFVLDNTIVKYIRSVDSKGKVILVDQPVELKHEINILDKSIAIKSNAMYLSAVMDTDRFTLAQKSIEWEHFTLDVIDHFDLDKTDVVLVSPDADMLDAARARLNPDAVNIKAVVDGGDVDENTVLNNTDSLWLINGRADQTRAIAERLQRRRGDLIPRGNLIDLSRKMLVTQTWLDNFNLALETDYEFIALGDAQTAALDLDQINGHKAINLAADRQDIRQSYLITRRIFERNRSIKFVLIGLTLESMSVAVDDHFSERGLDCRYIFADGGSTFDEKIFRSIFNEETELPSPDPEPVVDHIDAPIELNDRSLRQLEELIALCVEHGARPIGVLLPTIDQPAEQTDLLRRVLRYMERAFDFSLIDLSTLPTNGNVLNCELHRRGLLPFDEMRLLSYDRLHGLRSALTVDEYNDMMARIFDASIQTIKRKERIKVGFVVYDPAMWCGDLLYKLFADNARYETTLFLCLRMDETSSLIEEVYRKGVEMFKAEGLNVVGINQHNARIPKQDVFIYLTPYFAHLPRPFRSSRLTAETLITYIPYGFRTTYWNISDFKINFIAWKLFMDSKTLVQFMARNRSVDGDRLVYSGLPKMDAVLLSQQQGDQSDWKKAQPDAVKIIWAPHWSIAGFKYHRLATFQWNFKFMYEYAAAHPETSWIVKPHPQLLYSAVRTKTFESDAAFKEYLNKWDALPNARVVTGGYYQEIFASSDGMILDSGSFIAEYQFTHKPMLFLTRDGGRFSELGRAIIDANYHVDGKDFDGIKKFIEDVLINKHDTQRDAREKIFDEELNYAKDNGMLASEKIFRTIDDAFQR